MLIKDWVTAITEDDDIVIEGLCFLWTAALLFFASKCVKGKKTAGEMRVRDALIIGVFQGTAIMPGISRSGSTISSGLLPGLFPGILRQVQLYPRYPRHLRGQPAGGEGRVCLRS